MKGLPMRKPYKYTDRDPSHKCEDCARPIKRNVIARKTRRPRKCYRCWLKSKGRAI